MPILNRKDGTTFVIQPYREVIIGENKQDLIQRVRVLSRKYGTFVRFYKKGVLHHDAVFSFYQGYLLAESIKHYFNSVSNLIFCEGISHSKEFLFVVIRSGIVIVDTLITLDKIPSLLIPLFRKPERYAVVISGDSLLNHPFFVPAEMIQSYERLPNPLFPRLPAIDLFQLHPASTILPHKIKRMTQKNRQLFSFLLICLSFICFFALVYRFIENDVSNAPFTKQPSTTDHHQSVKLAVDDRTAI